MDSKILKVGDSVTHSDLGEGEILRVHYSLLGTPIYADVLWDYDPPDHYNLGVNPGLIEIRTLAKIENE